MLDVSRNNRANKPIVVFILILAAFLAPKFVAQAFSQSAATLTIKQAVALALQNNRDIALARVQYTIAQNQAGVYRSEFRPNLYTGSGAAYTSGFPSTPGGQLPALFSMSYNTIDI